MLRLHGEEKTTGESAEVPHARGEFDVWIVGVFWIEITVVLGYQPPYYCESEPGEEEIHREHHQSPSPLRVDQRRENILRSGKPLINIRLIG